MAQSFLRCGELVSGVTLKPSSPYLADSRPVLPTLSRPSLCSRPSINRKPVATPAPTFVCDALSASGVLPPPATYKEFVNTGASKADLSPAKIFLKSLIGGIFIALGGLLVLSVGSSCPGMASTNPGVQKILLGLFGLPFSLFLIEASGMELFTANTAFLTVAVLEERSKLAQLAKNWSLSFIGNLAGCLLSVFFVTASGLTSAADPATAIVTAKTSLPFVQAFLRGVLGNWLVCLAFWMTTAARSLSGKVLGIILPISSFVAMGFEHSITNMFLIPFGLAIGSKGLTMSTFMNGVTSNLIPVTLGNILGGAVCLGLTSALFFGKIGEG